MKMQNVGGLSGVAVAIALFSGTLVSAAEPIRVVILSGQNVHDWKATTPFLEKMYAESKRFKMIETVNDVSKITAATFAKSDVIVSNWTCHPVMTGGPWTAEGKKVFGDAVRAGKGFVQFHAACAACNDWEDFQELSGVTWKWAHTSHTAYHTFKVVVRDNSNPITKGLSDFWITDELYQKMAKMGKSDFRTLMDAFAEQVYSGTGKWEPMLLTTQLGKGRGVNFLLGHDVHAMQNIAWQTIMLRCTEWAANRSVTTAMPENWPTTASAAAIVGADLDAAIKSATTYAFGQGNAPISLVEQFVIEATSRTGKTAANRARLAAKLAEAIAACKTPEGKAFFCRQLAMIGTPDQVPAIAPLLADEKTAMMACYALERISGPASTKALRDSLGTVGCNRVLLLSVINAMGTKADPDAVAVLAPIVDTRPRPENDPTKDPQIVDAALATLGKIGTVEAADALRNAREGAAETLRPAITDALLNCAEHLLAKGNKPPAISIYKLLYGPSEVPQARAAALHGLVVASPQNATPLIKEALDSKLPELHEMAAYIVRNFAKTGDTREIGTHALRLSPDLQAMMITALADRADKAAAMTIRRAADSEAEPVRVAAIAAMGKLGDEGDVTFLMERAVKGTDAEKAAVGATLAAIPSKRAEKAIVDALTGPDANVRATCAAALVGRNAIDTLLQVIAQARADNNADLQVAILPVLSQIGSAKALEAVGQARLNSNPAVKSAALTAMINWPTAAAFGELLREAKDPELGPQRPAAVQALIRMLPQVLRSMPGDQQRFLRFSGANTHLIEEVLKVADRPQDKQAVLELLATQRGPDALNLAMIYARQPATADAAGLAAAKIAAALDDTHRDEVKKAMQEVRSLCKSPATLEAISGVLLKATRPINLARTATASSPDNLDRDGSSTGDAAGNDGDPATFWDETDGQKLYIFRLTWKAPIHCNAVSIKGHAFESHCPKDFDIVCDDKVVKSVQNAVYDRQNVEATFSFPRTTCTWLELRITGYYGGSPGIRELEVYDAEGSPSDSAPKTSQSASYKWHEGDSSIALLNHDRIVWRFNYGKDQPKPNFSPLNLPDGTELVWLNPPDHPWHHALWFSWKELNGLNYWEQGKAPAQGRTEVTDLRLETHPDFSATLELSLSYHPDGKPDVLTEQRILRVSPPKPDGSYTIDWSSTFTAANEDVHMKGGTAGGGYAGLSVRMSQDSRDWVLVDSENRRDDKPNNGTAPNTHGQHARWVDFSFVSTLTDQPAGVTVLDHPRNLRYPSYWHNCFYTNMKFGYFSPAPLWAEPYTLAAGKQLPLRYRILVHPGRPDPTRVETEFKSFAE